MTRIIRSKSLLNPPRPPELINGCLVQASQLDRIAATLHDMYGDTHDDYAADARRLLASLA